jgi:3-oxoacyl-[acyl-carrier-protein] synthase III
VLETTLQEQVDAPARRALRPAAIAGVAMSVPAQVVGNEPIADRLGIDPGWIVARTGVHERRVLAGDESLLSLAAEAAERALADAGVAPAEIDQVLVATMSHDRLTPALAPLVAQRIGAREAGALDVNAACTGFVKALAMAAGQIETGRADAILVVGAERLSTLTNHDDRSTAALFGDGAGAAVVRPGAGAGFGPFVLGSDGARSEMVRTERDELVIRMEGQDTFREAVSRMAQASLDAATSVGLTLGQIDLFIYHQANARILRALAQRLVLDSERVVECISGYGNTSAASVPIALATAVEDGRVNPGDRILLAAFGGGLTWGATVVEWEATT